MKLCNFLRSFFFDKDSYTNSSISGGKTKIILVLVTQNDQLMKFLFFNIAIFFIVTTTIAQSNVPTSDFEFKYKKMQSLVYKDQVLALKMLDTLEQISLQEADTTNLIKVLISQANLLKLNNGLESADIIRDRIEGIYTQRPADELYHFFKMNEAASAQKRGEYKKAIEVYTSLDSKLDTTWKDIYVMKLRGIINSAAAYRKLLQYDKAIYGLNHAIEIESKYRHKANDSTDIVKMNYTINNGLGLIFNRTEENDDALYWYAKAKKDLKKDDSRRYVVLSNELIIHLRKENYEIAEDIINEMFDNYGQLNKYTKRILLQHTIEYKLLTDNLDEAEKYLSELRLLCEDYKYEECEIIICAFETELSYKQKSYKAAIRSGENCIALMSSDRIIKRNKVLSLILKSYLSDNDSIMMEAFVDYDTLKTLIYNINLESGIQDWKVKYETELKESQIRQLEDEAKISALNLKLNKWALLFCSIGLIMSGLIIFFYRKALKSEKETNRLLDVQKQELATINQSLNNQINEWPLLRERFLTLPGKENRKIKLKDILYISADGNMVIFHTKDKKYRSWLRLKDVLSELPKDHFAQTHRSHIINIHEAKFENSQYLIMSNGDKVGLTRTYKSSIEQLFRRYDL